MKISEIRDLSIDELKKKNDVLVEELFNLRLRHAHSKLDSPAILCNIRKDIARIKTVLVEKEAR
jgi:large subunit ribosomal protein L29